MTKQADLLSQGRLYEHCAPCGQIIALPVLPVFLIISHFFLFFHCLCFSLHTSFSEVGEDWTAAGDMSVTNTQVEQMEQHGLSGSLPCWWAD